MRVVALGHEWVLRAIEAKATKYERQSSTAWTLLVYVNVPWADRLSWSALEASLEGPGTLRIR